MRLRFVARNVRAVAALGLAFVVLAACGRSRRDSGPDESHAGEAGDAAGGRGATGSGGGSGSATGGIAGSELGGTAGTPSTGGNSTGGNPNGGAPTGGAGAAGSGNGGAAGAVECPDGCSAECPCPPVNRFPPLVCVSPGDTLCGGPAPPPDECQRDADCADPGTICEPTGHCDARECVPGCTSADCTTSEVCGTDLRCTGKMCGDDDACGPNHACIGGFCARRPCEASSECDGACVNLFCFDMPGACRDPSIP